MTKPNEEDGFTLTETLVALLVTSLAMSTILVATGFVSRHFQRVELEHRKQREIDALEADIVQKLHPLEPIERAAIKGTLSAISYPCQGGGSCMITPHSNYYKSLHLTYISYGKAYSQWPPQMVKQKGESPRLEALILQDGQARTLKVIRFVSEQPKNCAFDMISRTCRKSVEP